MTHLDESTISNAVARQPAGSVAQPDVAIDVDVSAVKSPTLARLIEEVRNDRKTTGGYDRAYHRHNR